ncbi:MAG: PHP domain-containing protein [Anaerolineae bacterium]
MLRLDLHLHTTASDGLLKPTELVRLAQKQRLNAIAITDHDTTAGIAEAQLVAGGSPVVIPGIELSAAEGNVDVHMLGYYIQPENTAFQTQLTQFQQDRLMRGHEMVVKLAALGKSIEWERVVAIADGGAVGRPHVARALLEAGHVSSVNEAFQIYLYTGGPAYVARQRLSPEDAVDFIHSAGGVAVLAHPALVADYMALLDRLIPAGLDGVEIQHPKNTEVVRDNLRGLAARHDLIITGGSDFHRPGDSFGNYQPPPDTLRRLRERAAIFQNLSS